MVDFAKYIRIFHADPDDDFVTKRTAAIKEVEGVFKKKNGTDDLMKLANDLAIAIQHPDQLDPIVIDTVEKAIKKQSVAFVKEGQEMQMRVEADIKQIGKLLYQAGGHERMLQVGRTVAARSKHGRYLEGAWNGIGEWRG